MTRRRAMNYVDSVLVVYGREALTPERKAAELLAKQLSERAGVRCAVMDDQGYDPGGWQALIFVGHPDRHLAAAAFMAGHGVRRPNQSRPGPEGYVVRRVGRLRTPTVIIVGSDSRGCLYGVGAFLRAVDLRRPGYVGIPYLRMSSAPAVSIRGSDFKFWQEQRTTGLEMGLWSLEQWEEQIAELALWGINLIRRRLLFSPFETWLDERELMIDDGPGQIGWEMEQQINQIIHEYGLEVGISYPVNTIASAATRKDWHPGSPWPRSVCPSLPEARDRILYERLQVFKELAHIDHLFIPPYETGGCNCESCRPWAKTYLALADETAKYLYRYHPQAQVWLSNQGFSREENDWLLDLLERERPEWFQVIQYGSAPEGFPACITPADSDEQGLGTNLGEYPTLGQQEQIRQEMVRRVPVNYKLVLGPDVTHTFQPQYGLEKIDPALLWLHTLQSPFARPLGYHQVFRDSVSVSAGAVLYSEGLYDDFNKALWAEWMWSPNLSPWDATLAYTRWWFGESVARLTGEAIMVSEANWEKPLLGNDRVEQVVLQMDRAEMHIPPHLQEDNWRWTMWRLRTLLDLLTQHKLNLAQEAHRVARALLSEALAEPDEMVSKIQEACELLDLDEREARQAWLKEEIRDLNELLHYQIGVRLPAVANLDAELTNQGWALKQLRCALETCENGTSPGTSADTSVGTSAGLSSLRQAITLYLNYENPGPGGFYDDCGHIGRDPHFVSGHRIPAARGLDPGNRPSANVFAAGFGEAEDVVFAYSELDPSAHYRVRLTLVCPGEVSECAQRAAPLQAVQRLYASGFLVHEDLRLPRRVAQQYTFDLPRQAWSDGRLELRFVRAESGNMVAVSEIWLMREPV